MLLGSVLEAVPAGQRAEAVRQVAARLPEPAVDYVRLQASAGAPPEATRLGWPGTGRPALTVARRAP
jgi:hypothetical protein